LSTRVKVKESQTHPALKTAIPVYL